MQESQIAEEKKDEDNKKPKCRTIRRWLAERGIVFNPSKHLVLVNGSPQAVEEFDKPLSIIDIIRIQPR